MTSPELAELRGAINRTLEAMERAEQEFVATTALLRFNLKAAMNGSIRPSQVCPASKPPVYDTVAASIGAMFPPRPGQTPKDDGRD